MKLELEVNTEENYDGAVSSNSLTCRLGDKREQDLSIHFVFPRDVPGLGEEVCSEVLCLSDMHGTNLVWDSGM